MPRSPITIVALSLALAFPAAVLAQNQDMPLVETGVPCSACHMCDRPTPESLCLRGCNRGSARAVANGMSKEKVPSVVIMDELEDLYLPVPFDHAGHADMARMTRGCVVCHHYTPEGAEHPACKGCHEISPVREDMRKPSLKAAYHRQCMACHREWSHETACETCHQPKAGRGIERGAQRVPTVDDIMGQMHPPIPEPDSKTYQTKYKFVAGTKVLFRHKEHIHRFGYTCAECHHEDSCSRCHEEGKSEAERPKTLEEHHNPCATCHDMETTERCDHCHWGQDKPEPLPFDHARTGWPLGRYHQDKSCRVCHLTIRFTELDRSCKTCHEGWTPDNFNHAVTRQLLDETHAEIDCEECHADRAFDNTPTCDACHDKEDGIVFPDRRPGSVETP